MAKKKRKPDFSKPKPVKTEEDVQVVSALSESQESVEKRADEGEDGVKSIRKTEKQKFFPDQSYFNL
ncbi:MAG TPA: hypothetical protein DCZ74_04495, partial [Treponema sp.]|nr:hypothetical protein [Treponema sp.]